MTEHILPAALTAAAGLYLDARWQLGYDAHLFRSFTTHRIRERRALRNDSYNAFYLFEARCQANPDQTYLIYQGQTWTYKQAYDIALQHARWLSEECGVQSGQIVAFDCTNKPEFLWFWMALWSLGAKPAFINYNLTGRSLTHCIKTSTARLLLIDEELQDMVTDEVRQELGADVEVKVFTPATEKSMLSLKPFRADHAARQGAMPPDMALLIYTSGTTGLPKPAIIPWLRINGAANIISTYLGLKPTDVFHTPMPLYHSAGSMLGAMTSLSAGATFSLSHKFSPRTFWSEVVANNATVIQYVGETLRYLVSALPSPDERKHKVRTAFGNGLRPDVWARAKERFGIDTIAEFYASTEGLGVSWNLSRNDFTAYAMGRSGTVLRTLFRGATELIQLDIATEQPVRDPTTGLCKRTKPNTPGELVVKLDENNINATFQGYLGNESASNKKLLRDVMKKGDMFYRSGDLVRRNEDGMTYFVDRIGDTFRWKSENVATSEVAEILGSHPAIVEANVYGVLLPGHDGRAGCAAIVLEGEAGREPDERLLASLAQHATSNLASYARPVFLRFTPSFEQTGTNKTMKHLMREEGADPAKVKASKPGDRLFWLRKGNYVPFRERDWESLKSGVVRL